MSSINKLLTALAASILLIASQNSFAITSFLQSQDGSFCKYDNGTVLNVGVGLCPLSIDPDKNQDKWSNSGGMTTFLTRQYTDSQGNQICEYDNGSRINPGVNLCPLSRKY